MMETKVPGGKLVRMALDEEGRVRISGDFFIYPEEGLGAIEEALSSLGGRDAKATLSELVKNRGIELIGLDVDVLVRLYEGARDVEGRRA
ncbi:hypothetical protein Mtc_1899 [Methanocella conradii HZ254]|uniref:Lipoate--protein ligase n=1 Tax=Methanocella conradii (strain DSM 24694 / JCM 17849 / CGMCC 1.5162 / HZ254) TaxID=1041930 RepID=H8I4P4_METCZ|nr:hypothetical protein [Methanocella conradii]AFD00639.1 hypothetical protein Mtc_1899 [Methanocella conradii HZ254]MDI6896337.1 hypothetical protein [Methanocella conradii]